MYRLRIAPELEHPWRDEIEHEFSLALPHLPTMGLTANVAFGHASVFDPQYPVYRCGVEIRRGNQREVHVSAQNSNGRDAIRHALARARRDLTRARSWHLTQTESRERIR